MVIAGWGQAEPSEIWDRVIDPVRYLVVYAIILPSLHLVQPVGYGELQPGKCSIYWEGLQVGWRRLKNVKRET